MKQTEQVTNEDIYTIGASLGKLLEVKMQERAAYWIGRNLDVVEAITKRLNKSRDRLIKKYGDLDGKGNIMVLNFIDKLDEEGNVIRHEDGRTEKIKNPKVDSFNEEWEAVLSEEITIEYIPIPLSLLTTSKGERIDFSPSQFRGLGFLFKDIQEVRDGNS